jgi:hypothetical protein
MVSTSCKMAVVTVKMKCVSLVFILGAVVMVRAAVT